MKKINGKKHYKSPQKDWKVCHLAGILISAFLLGDIYDMKVAIAGEFDECGIESSIAFEDWRDWEKTSPKPYRSGEHRSWATIYFDDQASTSDASTNGEFTVCAKIVKVHFSDISGATPRKLFLMAKMPAGFDPDHGDWWYGNYNATAGAAMIEQGVVEACIDCHQRASGTDYVFFKEQIQNSTK